MKVYVSSNEGKNGGGGFDWFYTPEGAAESFELDLKHAPVGTRCWNFEVEVPDDSSKEQINRLVEDQLEDLQNSNVPAIISGERILRERK